MEQVVSIVDPVRQFAKDSVRFIKRCNKPDLKGKNIQIDMVRTIHRVRSNAFCPRFCLSMYCLAIDILVGL